MAPISQLKPLMLVSALAAAAALGVTADAQSAKHDSGRVTTTPGKHAPQAHIGMVQDWSHRNVIFTKARTYDETVAARLSQSRWDRMAQDPRYVMALTRRFESEANKLAPSKTNTRTLHDPRRRAPKPKAPADTEYNIARDWSNVLGGGANGQGGSGIEGVFPAKYNFDIGLAPDCANDFVVYPTNAAGATSSGVIETWIATFSANPGDGNTIKIGLAGPRQVVLTASNSNNSGTNFRTDGTNSERAANLAAAVNRWTSQTGFSAVANAAEITISANTTSNFSDSAIDEDLNNFGGNNSWGGVHGTETAGQPTIVAFNQLYQGTATEACKGSWNQNGAVKAPNVMWSYNTGTNFTTETSPTMSYSDGGKQIAFIQRAATSVELVLLRWKAGEGTAGAPATPATAATAADYRNGTGNCAANMSCMYRLPLNGASGGSRTYSSPFVDYAADVLWVADNNGRLHKFTGVFVGNPAEVIGGTPGFPATVASGLILSSPVYDFAGSVYVGSQSSVGTEGGKLHRINASTGEVFSSVKLANQTQASTGIRETPIVTDQPVLGGSVFAFLFNDGSAGDDIGCSTDPSGVNENACRTVARFALGFGNGSEPLQRAYAGRGNNFNSTLYAGAFDDAYYNTGTGAMYIIGGEKTDTFIPTMWKIPITAGVMGQSIPGATLGPKTCSTIANCITNPKWNWSAVTLVKNGSNEYFYFSMPSSANKGGCIGACLFMFNTSNLQNTNPTTWGTGNVPRAALSVPGGTGGIIVDNTSGATGASQVYFSHLANGGNAVQASQSGLQ